MFHRLMYYAVNGAGGGGIYEKARKGDDIYPGS